MDLTYLFKKKDFNLAPKEDLTNYTLYTRDPAKTK